MEEVCEIGVGASKTVKSIWYLAKIIDSFTVHKIWISK